MRFYDREGEIKKLRTLTSLDKSVMIVIYGRRRVGKTRLVQHVFGKDSFYFFVAEKEERLILGDFRTILIERCDYVPSFTDFDDFLVFCLRYPTKRFSFSMNSRTLKRSTPAFFLSSRNIGINTKMNGNIHFYSLVLTSV